MSKKNFIISFHGTAVIEAATQAEAESKFSELSAEDIQTNLEDWSVIDIQEAQ